MEDNEKNVVVKEIEKTLKMFSNLQKELDKKNIKEDTENEWSKFTSVTGNFF